VTAHYSNLQGLNLITECSYMGTTQQAFTDVFMEKYTMLLYTSESKYDIMYSHTSYSIAVGVHC